MHNPSLRREPRYEPAPVIPLKEEASLLDWLAANGRLKEREPIPEIEESFEEGEELEELIEGEDGYDDDFETFEEEPGE